MQLDIFIPSLSIAFEYQGEHHFKDLNLFGPQQFFNEKDEDKIDSCEKKGIKLISIPYWWDKKSESLVATILQKYPHLHDLMMN